MDIFNLSMVKIIVIVCIIGVFIFFFLRKNKEKLESKEEPSELDNIINEINNTDSHELVAV